MAISTDRTEPLDLKTSAVLKILCRRDVLGENGIPAVHWRRFERDGAEMAEHLG